MHLSTDQQLNHLPNSFPVGAVYVVEGRGGQYGHLRVSSRYVVLPSGQRVDVPADLGQAARGRALRRWQPHTLRRARNRAENRLERAKKIALAGGTTRQELR